MYQYEGFWCSHSGKENAFFRNVVGDLRRDTFQKNFHLGTDLIDTVHDSRIDYIGRNNLFPWKTRKHCQFLQPYGPACAGLQAVPLPTSAASLYGCRSEDYNAAYFTAHCLIHLTSANWNLLIYDNTASRNKGKISYSGHQYLQHASMHCSPDPHP